MRLGRAWARWLLCAMAVLVVVVDGAVKRMCWWSPNV
jgi:hypothetical protein